MTFKNINKNKCKLCGEPIPPHLNFCNLVHEDIFHELNDTYYYYYEEEKYE